MSGSFEFVQWNAYVQRLDLSLYCHPEEFRGNGVRNHVNSKGKIPSTGGLEGNGVRNHVNSKGKIPSTGGLEEGQSHDAASRWTVSPTHFRPSYSSPHSNVHVICTIGQ